MKNNNKAKTGMKLHKQIALGAKPKDIVTSKGVNSSTVNNIKRNTNNKKK